MPWRVETPRSSIRSITRLRKSWSRSLAASVGSPVPLESERGYHVQIAGATRGPRTSMMAADGKLIVHAMNGRLRAGGQVEIAGLAAPADWRRADILYAHLRTMFEGIVAVGADTYTMGSRTIGSVLLDRMKIAGA